MDYGGAIQAFEKALQVNPSSAAAHFELACLYEQKDADPAAAIYHYRCYLRLRPKAENTDTVEKRIGACKLALAKTVSFGPVSAALQADYERLNLENKQLRAELDQYKTNALRLAAATNPSTAAAPPNRPASAGASSNSASATSGLRARSAGGSSDSARSATTKRSYTVRPGDTPMAIAKLNGLRVDALMAANPGVEARRLKVGQILTLP